MAKRSTRRSSRPSSRGNAPGADVGRLESVQLLRRYPRGTLALGIALALGLPGIAAAGPGPCDPEADSLACSGNQSGGIRIVSPSFSTLRIRQLDGPISPASGDAVSFTTTLGKDVLIRSGAPEDTVIVETSGIDARGIVAASSGRVPRPPDTAKDPFLGVFIPGANGVSGGTVDVLSYSDITTQGAGAIGIQAWASTTGFDGAVTTSLTNFSSDGFTFEVTSVRRLDGGQATFGEQIAGVVIDESGNPVKDPDGNFVTAGWFVLNPNGSYTFQQNGDFDDLGTDLIDPDGVPDSGDEYMESRRVAMGYTVNGTNPDSSASQQVDGLLIATVFRSESSESGELVESVAAQFSTYGASNRPTFDPDNPDRILLAFPDLDAYVQDLLDRAEAGGAGSSVAVDHEGAIHTQGTGAHGIWVESQGARGPNGRDGSIWRSARPGGAGNDGGLATVTANGGVYTLGGQSNGVVAVSKGGDGGDGGDGGTWRWGQRGGTGGDGGRVQVFGSGVVDTEGAESSGIVALSIGGNGGRGGTGKFVTPGGAGGYGGRGGEVVIAGSWDITTLGDKAHGIWARSLGGTAGSGGSGGWLAGAPGGGGQATDGGRVEVTSSGKIETVGDDAHGLHVQSVGGFGGQGGGGFSLFYSHGGSGASAGSGGEVIVHQLEGGSITTTGVRSHGMLVQSVGGGGGSGGGTSGLVSLGGEGGAGGNGGSVTVGNAGSVLATGDNAYGILAQSIGGGGGAGGSGGGFVSLGGGGTGGGEGGSVEVRNTGVITATGSGSVGIFAESVGGGGGDGGSSGGAFAVGGSGSATSDGGDVNVFNQGTVTSASTAIFAQSIGGGGGNGGSSGGWFSFGGSGGGGGGGGGVTVDSAGSLETTESNASGIFAQSVGGGGGNGGNSVAVSAIVPSLAIGGDGGVGGDGSLVDVASGPGTITTKGDRSRGVFAQSVGGGGGNGGFAASGSVSAFGIPAIAISLGGKGAAGGAGGEVRLRDSQSDISTLGADSHGIFVQSVGGGGGSGGFSIALSGGDAFAGSLSIGGTGGAGGRSGDVRLGSLSNSLTGTITTAGNHAYGILAQSVGGSGGDGGFSIAASLSGGVSASLSFGGVGGEGGYAGNVDLFSANLVETIGNDSHGIFAQSVGGGGGSGGFGITGGLAGGAQLGASFGGAGGDGANAGVVSLVSSGEQIATWGNHSYGVLAQSIGGGGGDGGFSVAGGISSSAAVNFSMGGSGGNAGLGGEVTLANSSNVYTLGQDSHGVFAQSVGGGGGSGGFSATGGISAGSAQVGASIGGAGGEGGNADRVSLTSTGELVATAGDRSYGLLAQSVGGSGGAGGFSVAGGISQSASVNFALGGSGGDGGQGGVVELTSSTQVETLGVDAHGLFAQSLGGGGGVGGFAVTGGISAQSATIGAAIGGAGGDGGKANAVTLTSTGETVTTFGDRSYGLLAQSVGGSGGAGGFTVAGGISQSASVNFGLGGSGGGGGAGSTASLTSSSIVQTHGADAHGLFVQSVGGGGGVGGFAVTGGISAQSAQIGAAIGGAGGDGGQAGRVALTSTGQMVTTSGDRSYGLLAQSIGGSGGTGGFSVAGGISKSAAVNFGLGGSGGEGGAVAGTVSLVSQSDVYTQGLDAHGLFAQSVGGGGGAGGFAVTGGISTESAQVGASVGGSGGGGAQAGRVDLHSLGQVVSTTGDRSHGVLAQSIGGVGGSGGFAIAGGVSKSAAVNFGLGGEGGDGAVAGAVNLVAMSDVYTQGADAYGLFAQSVGGGGGAGGFAVTGGISTESAQVGASVGGSGGEASRGDKVAAWSFGQVVSTSGDRSYGVLAQSIGGSGGSGGFAIAGGVSKSAAVNFGLGGSGGAGSLGGEVEVHSESSVATQGAGAHGLFAQSVGGGGGAGGFSVAGGVSRENAQISAGLGGSGGGGGDASLVQLFSSGDTIMTAGERAFGILAQSVGGGGGDGGFSLAGGSGKKASINFSMGGSGGTAGAAGNLYLENSSAIYTEGGNSHGILAQSIGGGGGSGGFSATGSLMQGSESKQVSASIGGDGGGGGNAGSVEVLNAGDIETLGLGAFGVLAQSVGGGGGDGGHAHVVNLVTEGDEPKPEDKAPADEPAPGDGTGTDADKEKESKSWSVGLAIGSGGDGAKAGDGGMVTLESDGDVVTRGAGSHALFAQSVGGGGGTGGMATTDGSGGGGDVAVELGFSLGGSGGEGGSAAEVRLTNAGTLVTLGAGAHGIVAQSIGGGGGSGGASASSSKAANSDSKVAVNINAAIGGAGGVAGDGGNVAVNHEGMIDTSGARAYGVLAQSVGGGGGDGGESAAKIEADDGEDEETPPPAPDGETDEEEKVTWSVGLAIGAGGEAGAAGDGGTVQLDSSGDVVTRGIGSHALFAQSVGGGGGAGGITATDGSGGGGNVSVGLGFSLGGRAGGGGSAGLVSVKSTGTLVTLGAGAHGVVAQSIGGGGGSGGASVSSGSAASSEKQVAVSLNAAIGGAGGVAGDGGRVLVQNDGLIDTSGYGAFGVLAQSVGGGGGDGGASVSMPGGGNSSHLDLAVSVGGGGGVAGRGAEVLVENTGGVVTRGEDAHAIFAQSVGGGGGSGGSSIAASGGNRGLTLDFGIGGGGGAGNDGGVVTISNQGDIDTFGDESYGLLAQSVGGGGGRGGNAGVVRADVASDDGDGGADLPGRSLALSIGGAGAGASDGGIVGIDNTGDIRTRGDGSFGIFVQSIGGGGGSGGYGGYASTDEIGGEATLDLQLALGGGAGSSGDGGKVDVMEAGNVVTGGEGAIAVFAQSIGGGGGVGGLGISGALGGIAIGGEGGAGGSGGTVDVDITGSVETFGTAAFGVFAQSVGGGGGMAGNVSAGLGLYDAIGLGVGFGQAGGGGGDGGVVSVATSGDIVTHGAGASGIYAQSVGGGGGLAGNLAGTLAFAGSVGGPGSAGTVEVRHDGDIVTYGQAAHGIFAQSAAGTDSAAAVDVSVTGNVVAYGLDSSAIFAQSRGDSGTGNIRIDVLGGSAIGGPGDGAGVYLSGGAGNLLVNRGNITSVDDVDGFAVRAGTGDDAVENHGIITGSIALGGGANSLFNAADATLNTGAILDLGSGNQLFNEGSIAPGGQGSIMATVLTGNLVDSATAIHSFDVDMRGGLADSLLVTGTAEVQGILSVGFVGPVTATVQQYRLLNSTSSLDFSGIQLDASLAPAALVVSIENDGMGSWLKLSPDFTMTDVDLSGNQKSVGAYLNAMIDASPGGGMQKVLDSVIALQSADAVAGSLEQLQPLAFTSLFTTGVFSQQRFGDALQSCRSRDGEFRFSAESECAWGRIAARDFSQDAKADTVGFDQRSYELSTGMQKAIGDQQHWFMGFGLGYEDSGLDAKPASEIDGQQLQAGAVLKGRFGATSLSLGLLGGIGDYDSSRQLLVVDPQAVASSQQDSSYYAGDLRFAYDFSGNRGYIRPQVSFGAGSMRIDGFRESGADAANLIVESQTHHFATLRPAVEIGGEFGQAGGTLWRPFARVGVTHFLDGNTQSVTARMEGAPEGVPPFVVTTEMDTTYTDVGLGLDVLRSAGLSLRIGYEGQFSGSTDQHSVQVKIWVGF